MTTAATAPAVQATITTHPTAVQHEAGTVQLRLNGGAEEAESWFSVCSTALLTPGRGVPVLLPDGRQAALFRDRAGRLYAIDNRDPFTGASVLARGLLGSDRNTPFVASPLLKQRFALADGRCLDDDAVSVTVYEVRVAHAELAHAG